ncbi:ABC transporter permease [Streptomyces cinnamoneus]|uniref:Transport permease protein n=1 Tax=Streptomyces cinnamoneus TaxID=53446 RepID=A0A2G1XPR7_STRCJ|nr:ABC transporter permease [Streptomyces cinnamoneus]PHQ53222.1 ABC transporter permease [Streptomyces cinnamoneus]PPT12314.1 ABC transporter permease [Streptomyces cinnamoneus]
MARALAQEHPGAAQPPAQWTGAGIGTQIAVLTGKSLRKLVTDPKLLIFSVLQPLVLLLLFGQVFTSVATTPHFPDGVGYIEFLVPAILVTTSMQSALMSGVGLNEDIKNGVVARFRSMPIWLGSVLVARSVFDVARAAVRLLVLLVLATVLFGFSPAGGVPGVLAAVVLALLIGFALAWIFMAIACWLRNAEAMQGVGFLVMFPLMFASNALVPTAGLPGWLQVIAHANPMSYGIDASRHLMWGQPAGTSVLASVGTSAVLAVVAAVVAERGFRRPQ